MSQLQVTKIHISLKIKIADDVLERHLASSVSVVGKALTEAVLASVKKNTIGYYPALEYIQQLGDMDEDLMDAAETIGCLQQSWHVKKYSIRCALFFLASVFNRCNLWRSLCPRLGLTSCMHHRHCLHITHPMW